VAHGSVSLASKNLRNWMDFVGLLAMILTRKNLRNYLLLKDNFEMENHMGGFDWLANTIAVYHGMKRVSLTIISKSSTSILVQSLKKAITKKEN
jgi:hypothetical protein